MYLLAQLGQEALACLGATFEHRVGHMDRNRNESDCRLVPTHFCVSGRFGDVCVDMRMDICAHMRADMDIDMGK